jgi:hypothetical protein
VTSRPAFPTAGSLRPLVEAVRTAPGTVAVLAGAGISNSAGIATGEDLLRRQAARHGHDPGLSHPVAWYRSAYGSRPNYIHMLGELIGTATARGELPRAYFEPDPRHERQPTPAHRALADLVAAGYLRVILTTNFDRLLEAALARAGVTCTVTASLDAMAAATEARGPAAGSSCMLIKLHGDYLDMRIRDTSAGRDAYHPRIDALLAWVLGDFDLLVCGWSAAWDVALGRALAHAGSGRRTFWMLRGRASPEAARLIARRRAHVIPVFNSDTGLSRLATAVLAPA